MPHRRAAKFVAGVIKILDTPPIVNRIGFQLWVLILSIFTSISLLIAGVPPSIEQRLLHPFIYVWVASLFVLPLVIIYAMFKRDRINGLRLECYMLGPYGGVLLVYPIAVIARSGDQAIVTACFSLAAAGASLTTAWLIRRDLRRLGLWKARH